MTSHDDSRISNPGILARLNRIYSALDALHEAVLKARTYRALYEDACRIVVEQGLCSLAWIGAENAGSGRIVPVARWGEGADYLDVVSISKDESSDPEPSALAVRERKPSACHQIDGNEAITPWRSELLARGVRASASWFVQLEHRSVGAFTLYFPDEYLPTDEEAALMNRLALNISLAVEAMQREEQRRKDEEQDRETLQMYRTLLEQLPIITYIAALNETGSTLYVSPQVETILGFRLIDWMCNPDCRVNQIHAEDRDRVVAELAKSCADAEPFQSEYRMVTGDGRIAWLRDESIVTLDSEGRPLFRQGLMLDITEQKNAEEQRIRNAFHDTLTGLPNRALFLDRLSLAFTHLKRHKDSQFAVLFLDLDRFKLVNDSLGHLVGDQLIVEVGNRLKSVVRACDTIARLSGDDFAVLVNDIEAVGQVMRMVERLRKGLEAPLNLEGHELTVTASIGIALSETSYERPEYLLRDAEVAMYRAKAKGRGQTELFNETMSNRAMTALALEQDLRKALENNEFHAYYQPIVRLEDRRIVGAEALIRWIHPQRGMVSPLDFIPVAEDSGQILPIGEWVLREVCTRNAGWQKEGLTAVPIAVNLSARQFSQNNLVATVEQILSDAGLQSAWLKLELTESNVMENAERSIEMLKQLKEIGIRISIDDFGTGYSSLAYLKRLPIGTIKIDRSFVKDIPASQDDAAIAAATIAMAHSLRLDVVAEGIETEEQLNFLRQQGCDYAQGYLFSRPVPAADFAKLLEKGVL